MRMNAQGIHAIEMPFVKTQLDLIPALAEKDMLVMESDVHVSL
jgi:hypothetical protein